MKKFFAWGLAFLCAVGLVGCAEIDSDAQRQSGDSDAQASRFERCTVTAAYDYGFHRTDLATILYDGSSAFFDLPDGLDQVLAGDVFTIEYSGELLIQESYPSSVVFQGGKVESVSVEKAKLVRLTYYAPYEGALERFVILHDNGTEEEIEVAARPDRYITDAEGHFESLSEGGEPLTLFGSYSAVDGYDEAIGYKFAGFYTFCPRGEA